MPPATRSRAGGSGAIKKQPTRKPRNTSGRQPSTNGDAWAHSQVNGHDEEDVRQSVEDHDQPIMIQAANGVQDALNPLKEMADKVGREVELFAMELDSFLEELPTQENKYQAAQSLVESYYTIAKDAVDRRRERLEKERTKQLKEEWSERAQLSTVGNGTATSLSRTSISGSLSAAKAAAVKELRQYEQEMDIWELFKLMLELEKFPVYTPGDWQAVKDERYAKLEEPHLYTAEAKIWERFLVDDELARERSKIIEWLAKTADHQDNDLEAIMAELEAQSGAGQGLWNAGWMNTREKIKGEKRLRSWPSGSQSVRPQIRSTTGNEMIATTLDPDAPAREQRALEKPDAYYEKAVWIAIWEMLRRGTPRHEIRAWCEERGEGWRSALLSSLPDDMEAVSNSAWRRMCYVASQGECSSDYEAAVYGLLGGNVQAAQEVCRTVDDHLFAYYSATLVLQFEAYLRGNYPSRAASVSARLPRLDDFLDSDKARDDIDALRQRLREGATKSEAMRPIKIIEGYLISKEAESLVVQLGLALSDLDKLRGGHEEVITRFDQEACETQPAPEQQIALDTHALRIVTHMYIVLRAMDSVYSDDSANNKTPLPDNNVIMAYMQFLRASGKRDAALVYATQLPRESQNLIVAKVLQDVSTVKDQKYLLDLLEKHGLQTVPILEKQLDLVLKASLGEHAAPLDKPLQILEVFTKDQKLYPSQRIDENFFPEQLEASDVAIVQSLKWFQMLQGEWQTTFSSLSLVVRKCLVTGRFACAAEIIKNLPFSELSPGKAYHVLRHPINIMEQVLPVEADEETLAKFEVMRSQARTYYELEQLITAVGKLAAWVDYERSYTRGGKALSAPPADLKRTKTELDEAMQPLLSGVLLNPVDEDEDADLQHIRKTYLPEIIIAYNTALHTAGPVLTRDSYIDSMDLSVAIAAPSSGLTEVFQQAGRMRELVDSFAQTSKMMLIMKSGGRSRKASKDKVGKDWGIWEVGPQGAGAHQIDVS